MKNSNYYVLVRRFKFWRWQMSGKQNCSPEYIQHIPAKGSKFNGGALKICFFLRKLHLPKRKLGLGIYLTSDENSHENHSTSCPVKLVKRERKKRPTEILENESFFFYSTEFSNPTGQRTQIFKPIYTFPRIPTDHVCPMPKFHFIYRNRVRTRMNFNCFHCKKK